MEQTSLIINYSRIYAVKDQTENFTADRISHCFFSSSLWGSSNSVRGALRTDFFAHHVHSGFYRDRIDFAEKSVADSASNCICSFLPYRLKIFVTMSNVSRSYVGKYGDNTDSAKERRGNSDHRSLSKGRVSVAQMHDLCTEISPEASLMPTMLSTFYKMSYSCRLDRTSCTARHIIKDRRISTELQICV